MKHRIGNLDLDMDPQTLQTFSQLFILVGILLTALGGYGAFHFGRVVDRQRRAEAETRESGLRKTLEDVVEGNRRLEEGSRALQDKLAPFNEIARRLYPGIESDAALGRLSREVESLRSRATVLENKTAARRVDASARAQLVRVLRPTGSHKVGITCVVSDAEGFQFASDLKDAIEAAGWQVEIAQGIYDRPPRGLLLRVKSVPPPEEAIWLAEAFQAARLKVEHIVNPNADGYELIVGVKP